MNNKTLDYFQVETDSLRKIKVLSANNSKEYSVQKILFDTHYFCKLEVIRRISDNEKFIVIKENDDKTYIVTSLNSDKNLYSDDLVVYNTCINLWE